MAQALRDTNRVPTLVASNTAATSTIAITGSTLTDSKPLHVAVMDGNGDQITTFGASLSSTPKTGQKKIAVTGTAVQLSSNTLNNGVIVTAYSTNAAPITVGDSSVTNTINGTGNGAILEAGASLSYAVSNTNVIWVNGTAGDIISFSGS